MDPSSSHNNTEPNEAISALVNEFLDRRQAGEALTLERFAAEHPEVAVELCLSLEGLPLIEKARVLASTTAAPEAPRAAGESPAVEGYELVEEIGRGGMGVVYKALQTSTKRIVALKVMLGGTFASEPARRRFQREVELAARLRHPNIVAVLEGGHVADRPYYAMEYVSGVQLKRYLSTAEADLRATLGIFERMCEAVDYAHRQGVIHRDLKPGNVLVDDEGQPHVLDFGLAKGTAQADLDEALTPRAPRRGLVMGTLFYLSPEQALGTPDETDARSDVYALGVMLFEALTGSLPFDTSGRPSQVVERILETPPAPPSSLSRQVNAELETIILKALEKDKAHRYQSAKALAEDIRRYLEGEPVLACRPSGLYVFRKKLWKRRRLAAAVGVVVVAAVVLTLASLWDQARSKQRQWAQARQAAVKLQRDLEAGADVLGRAGAFREQCPELCEALLIFAHAEQRTERSWGAAIPALESALQRDPSLWPCRALLGEIYREGGDLERADALAARAKRDAPDTAEAWYLRSFSTLDRQHAMRCVQQAVQRDPSHVLAWERLTYMRVQVGDPEGALQAADRLMELGRTTQRWTAFKGRVLAQQGRFREAMEHFTAAGAYLDRAHTYRRLKEYDKAVADYTSWVEAHGEPVTGPWLFYQRATPLWILGRTEEALADYERFRILLGRPFYSDARAFLILRELGRQREAQQVLNTALRDVKDDRLRQVFRCLAGQLTPEQLVADALARDNPEQLCEAYYYAAEVCLLAGERAAARKWFEQCVQTGLAFDPDSSQLATPMNEYELAEWRLEKMANDE